MSGSCELLAIAAIASKHCIHLQVLHDIGLRRTYIHQKSPNSSLLLPSVLHLSYPYPGLELLRPVLVLDFDDAKVFTKEFYDLLEKGWDG